MTIAPYNTWQEEKKRTENFPRQMCEDLGRQYGEPERADLLLYVPILGERIVRVGVLQTEP